MRPIADVAKVTKFEPDWRIYARSASDDKSPIVALCAAIDALKSLKLAPTSNIRVILDGEEEASSPSLVPAIGRYREKLKADLMVILDGPIHSSGRPTIAYGARGIVTLNLTVFGPKVGVHSGNYGNWIPNPAQRLATLLASMKQDDGRVTVKGFYDAIVPLTAEEQALLDGVPDDAEQMLRTFGVAEPEKAFSKMQTALQSPTLNVRGLTSAHVGAGARTIIPDRATAAIDLRLVKETPAADLVEKIRAHVRSQGYHVIEGEPDDATRAKHGKIASLVVSETMTSAFRTAPSDPQARRVAEALRDGIRRAAGATADAGRYGSDRAVHRSAGLPGDPRARRQFRQQSARGERESANRESVSVDRDRRGDPAELRPAHQPYGGRPKQ